MCEVAAVLLLLLQAHIAEWIALHHTVAETHRRNTLKDSHQLFRRVERQPVLHLQERLKIEYKGAVYLSDSNILAVTLLAQELLQAACSEVKFVKCRLGNVDTYQRLLTLVKLIENRKQRGVFSSNTEKLVTQYLWRNNLARFGEILLNGD